MKRHFALVLAAAAAVLLASCMTVAVAPAPGGVRHRTGCFSASAPWRSRRIMTSSRSDDTRENFRSLVVVVEKNDIELYNVVVVYGNGERDKFKTRYVFRGGTRSRDMQFAAGQRRIRAIEFTYKTVGDWQDGRARVLVYGVR